MQLQPQLLLAVECQAEVPVEHAVVAVAAEDASLAALGIVLVRLAFVALLIGDVAAVAAEDVQPAVLAAPSAAGEAAAAADQDADTAQKQV